MPNALEPKSGDTYYRYVGPQQQPRPKGKAAAAAPADGAAGSEAPAAKQPKEPGHPPPNWQPSPRSLGHPSQPASTGPKVSISVRKVPQPPKSGSQGVAAFGRDTAVPVASSPAKPPAKARPKPPGPKSADTLADRIRNLPPPPPGVAPSPPPLPPPSYPPPSDNIPPPPTHPPPSLEELAVRSSQQAEAREGQPGDPNDPQAVEEGEWVEEEEEEEPREEDVLVEVEEEEPEFPDFPTRGREPSTRHRRPKRNRSDPPIPVSLVPRATRERIELNQELFRARAATGVSRRPLALRPQVHGYPEIRIDPSGTWARVADPPIVYAPQTFPYIVPRGEGQYPELRVDPHVLPDSVWRDPSLRTHSNLDPNSIVNIATDNPATESEGSETPETAVQRFTASGAAFSNQEGPVEAGFAERVPTRPVESPPKRPRVNIRISQVQRDIKPAQARAEGAASTASASSTSVPSLSVPTLRGSVPPWRQQPPQQNQEPVEVADQPPVVATGRKSRI